MWQLIIIGQTTKNTGSVAVVFIISSLWLKCIYYQNQMIKFPVEGYDGCFSLIPTLDGQGQMQNPIGAGLFVSEEGVKALWVNLYVFNQNNPNFDTSAFKSVYNDPYLSILALVQGRLMGPIKIWEIDYPEDFTVDEDNPEGN